MNILDIKYCAQDLRFEEDAYKIFETYEQELKEYFLEQADGSEIFEDLKLRICEMLQSKMKISGEAITETDIEDIKKSIGYVKQLEEDMEDEDTVVQEPQPTYKDKKLYRNENEKMIAGVCGGLGNYFSLDPLAFRLLFVLVVVMSKGFGLLAYVILWAVLKPKALPTNLSKRLYRNGADKVIAGVCGGLAAFFKIEAWIVRVIFLSPLILNIVVQGLFDFNFSFFHGSAIGFSFISYIILWITTKESETPTEGLLARGEDITINNLSEESGKVHSNPSTNSGFNNFLRIIAFIVIGFALVFVFFLLVTLVFGSVFMTPLTSAVLYTPLMKWLGALSILFFVLLPLVGFVVWAIRRIGGYKAPNKPLRMSFGGLWALGFTSAIILSFLIFSEMHGDATVTERIDLPVQGDTLYVKNLDQTESSVRVTFKNSVMKNFYVREHGVQVSKIVSFRQRESEDGNFHVEIRKSAQGKGEKGAIKNARLTNYKHEFKDNKLYVSQHVSLPNNEPFRFQHAKVIFYVPKGKVLISDPEILKIRKGRNHYRIQGDWDDIDEDTKREIGQEVEEAMEEVGDAMEEIGDAMEDVGVSIEKAGKELGSVDVEIEKAEEEAAANIRIEKQKLRIKKEQLRLEKLEQELKTKEGRK